MYCTHEVLQAVRHFLPDPLLLNMFVGRGADALLVCLIMSAPPGGKLNYLKKAYARLQEQEGESHTCGPYETVCI